MKAIHWITISYVIGIIYSQDVHLKITDRGAERIRIAVMPFVPRTEYPDSTDMATRNTLYDAMVFDLSFSPFFTVIDTEFIPQRFVEEEEINPFEWASAGIQAIVFGSFKVSGSEVKIDARLYSVSTGKRILRKKLSGDILQTRRMAHSFDDDVVKALTGEKGIAQTQIVFVSKRTGAPEIWICDYDGYFPRRITADRSIVLSPHWSPDGNKITFTSYRGGDPDVFIHDLGRNQTEIISAFPGLDVSGIWSPDGRKVALVLSKDGNSEIYVMDVRTKSLERLTYNPGIDTDPTWSPDGHFIAFCSDRSGSPQIYIMDETGAGVKRLTYNAGDFCSQPSWSPKGDKIAFASRARGQFDIAVIDVTGENITFLTSIGNNEHPSWSPDGYHITFSSDRLGSHQLYIMLWDGTQIRRITNTQADNMYPSWSPRFQWNFE